MSSDEDEVFEIDDFTCASDWERFISLIEQKIREWGLNEGRFGHEVATNQCMLIICLKILLLRDIFLVLSNILCYTMIVQEERIISSVFSPHCLL